MRNNSKNKAILFCAVLFILVAAITLKAAEEKGDFYGSIRRDRGPFWAAYEQQEPEQIEQSQAQFGATNPERILAELLAVHTGAQAHELEAQLSQADTDHDRALVVRSVVKSWLWEQTEKNKDAHYRPYMAYRRAHEVKRCFLVRNSHELAQDIEKAEQKYESDRKARIRAIGWNAVGAQELAELAEQSPADHPVQEQARRALEAKRKLDQQLGADRLAYERDCAELQAEIDKIKNKIREADERYENVRRSEHVAHVAGEQEIEARLTATKNCLNQFFAQYLPGIQIK
jgi:hypothetical protein